MSKPFLCTLWIATITLLAGRSAICATSRRAQLAEEYVPRVEKILTQNIAPFWHNKSLDRDNGGYIINFGLHGEPMGPGTKMIVTQARMVWLFSRMARAGYKRQEYLDAADLGYRFLKEKMWDPNNGGFFWEVDVTGNQKLKADKHLYGQSFGLYAISEYYLATQKKEALDFAIRVFNLLEDKAHDKTYGGYVESFLRDWTPAPANAPSYMGEPSGLKLMNTHLHMMEAMTTFYRASKLPVARERLVELIFIQSNTVVRKDLGACTDKYERDWTPRLDGNYARVSYGHDIENVWLLMDACDAAGISNYPFMDLYKTLSEYSLKYGYDEGKGGFYYTGGFNQQAGDRNKSWWVQAEALVSALRMYRSTNAPKYRQVFEKTFDFVEKNLVDWDNGEWYSNISPSGQAQGPKAEPWKAGYHNGRAMIECLEVLKACGSAQETGVPGKALPVILDTDICDDIDDTWALALLLRSPELDVRLITTAVGNTQAKARVVAKFLQAVGRADIPIGIGVSQHQGSHRQTGWTEGYDLSKYPGTIHRDGVQALVDTVMTSQDRIAIIAVGPLPNIAAALQRQPRIADKADFVGMHGSIYRGYGSQGKPEAEYNVRAEVKAAQKVFGAPWKMTITPLDTCGLVQLQGQVYKSVLMKKGPLTEALIDNYRVWTRQGLRDQYKDINEPDLDRKVAEKINTGSTTLFDTVAVYLAFRQEWVTMETLPLRITDDGFTRIEPGSKEVRCATAWKDRGAFEDWLASRLAQ